jgi:hypothetical protein
LINKQSFEKKSEKRFSKSIDPRKDKSFMSEASNNAKEKKSKKEKMDVFARLTSKSIGNFKKLRLDINGPSNSGFPHLLSSKSKNKKLTSSSKSIHNLVNKKNDADKEKDKNNSPSNNISVKNSKKLISTPKLKQKQLKKLAQIKLEDSNNTLGTQSSKNMVTSSKIKKTNSKGKLTKRLSKALAGLKQEEKNIVINNFVKKNSEILPENNDNKVNNEIKIESKNDSNKEVKQSTTTKEKSLIEDDIIKDVNQDELLISQIKMDKIEEINLDNADLKTSINLDIPLDDTMLKKSFAETNNKNSESTNSLNNNNKSINNIKVINSQNNTNINNN